MHSFGLSPGKRLRKRAEFSAVYAQGRSWSHPLLRLLVSPNQLGLTRFGFVVGKRVGKAVVRNQLKRRLREAARRLAVRPGYDVIIIGRSPAVANSYQALQEGLQDVLRRARLLRSPGEPRRESSA